MNYYTHTTVGRCNEILRDFEYTILSKYNEIILFLKHPIPWRTHSKKKLIVIQTARRVNFLQSFSLRYGKNIFVFELHQINQSTFITNTNLIEPHPIVMPNHTLAESIYLSTHQKHSIQSNNKS